MANICYIGKFPPIQGGVSSSSFWQLLSLANAGHEVHVISNNWEVEEQYRQYFTGEDLEILNNYTNIYNKLYYHFTNPFFEPFHIPFNRLYTSKLASKAIQVIDKYNCDIIYSYYFEPYGVSAFIASNLTGRPFILRHAGSDITRLFNCNELKDIYLKIIDKSCALITQGRSLSNDFLNMVDKSKIKNINSDFLPENVFNTYGNILNIEELISSFDDYVNKIKLNLWNNRNYDSNKITIGIYCKAGFHKGILEVIKALNLINNIDKLVNLVIVSGGRKLSQIQDFIKSNSKSTKNIYFLPFLPPWRIPEYIRSCNVLLSLENNFPIDIHGPRIAKEVISCGRCLILSNEIANKQIFRKDLINYDNCILVNNVQDIDHLSYIFNEIIYNLDTDLIGSNASKIAKKYNLHDSSRMLEEFNQVFESII